MIIDAHVHIGSFWGNKINLSNTLESALEEARKHHIEKIFCTSTISLQYDFEEGDLLIRDGMKKYPHSVLAYATVPSPRHGGKLMAHLKRCFLEDGFHGIKIYSHTQGLGSYNSYITIADEYMHPVLEFAQRHAIPVLSHSSPSQCDHVCGNFPELRLIMAHMGATPIAYGMWHDAIAVAKRRPRLILDTTGSGMDLGMVEEAVRVIGDERIIWGSDSPLLGVGFNLAKITRAEIPRESKDKILGQNIVRLVSQISR
jgi:predicted TIM-barrel fold metal-dependent hydrolase